MGRAKIDLNVAARLLDALRVHRAAALQSLPLDLQSLSPYGSSGSCGSGSVRSLRSPLAAERIALPLLQSAVRAAADGRAEVGSALEGRRLVGLDLAGATLAADLTRSDLSSACIAGATASNCALNLSLLRDCDMRAAQFHSCTFLAANAAGANARGARFSHCVFTRADLSKWDVRGATFYRCSFTMADLSGWVFDTQTVVVDPTDWERCRRVAWTAAGGHEARECRVIGGSGRLSLAPRDEPRGSEEKGEGLA